MRLSIDLIATNNTMMKRRNFIQLSSILSFVGLAPVLTTNAANATDSIYAEWCDAPSTSGTTTELSNIEHNTKIMYHNC